MVKLRCRSISDARREVSNRNTSQKSPLKTGWVTFYLETPRFDNPEVGRHPVAKLDLDDVPQGELGCLHSDLLTVPAHDRVLGNQVLEALHDLGRFGLLFRTIVRVISG